MPQEQFPKRRYEPDRGTRIEDGRWRMETQAWPLSSILHSLSSCPPCQLQGQHGCGAHSPLLFDPPPSNSVKEQRRKQPNAMSTHAKDSNGRFHQLSAPDFLPLPQLRDLQLQRLKAIVQRAYDNVALFHKRMDERGLTPKDVQSLEDLAKLPFAEKTDLRDTYPFGLFASPMKDIVRLHASSGTTGKPIVVAYTQEDIQVWTNVMVRSFAACGLHAGDIIQNAYGYGLFTGGLGAHYGAEALGATVIPISGGNTQRQIDGDEGFRRHGHLLHAQLFPPPHRPGRRAGHQHQRAAPARRRLRRRAVDRIHAPAHRSRQRHQGLRHLRAVGNHRPRRGHGMPVPGRAAYLRGLLLSRDHRPEDRQAAAATARRANWS